MFFVFSYIFSYIWFKNTCVFLKENPPQQNSHLKNARLVVSRKERYLNAARKQIGGACRSKQKVSVFFGFDPRVPNEDPGSLGTSRFPWWKIWGPWKKRDPIPGCLLGIFDEGGIFMIPRLCGNDTQVMWGWYPGYVGMIPRLCGDDTQVMWGWNFICNYEI